MHKESLGHSTWNDMKDVDYSVYLVTGRDLLPSGKNYLDSLEEAIQGGVTVVQIREKGADTGEFIRIARQSKDICDRYNIPLIINDRVDIALAVNASGIHLGQDDMHIRQARQLLPKGTIIGVSCNTVDHVIAAAEEGADYVGIGAVWGTQTKNLTSPVIGVRHIGDRLKALDGTNVKAVAIGGIKSGNLLRTLHGTVSDTGHALDGIAIVSEIMGSQNPKAAASELASIIKSFQEEQSRLANSSSSPILSPEIILAKVAGLMQKIRNLSPLVHQITNNVVATQSANITLALGASPIMATEPSEMEDLALICGALLVNIGTMRAEALDGMKIAGYFANSFKKPVVLDPVGIGASTFRKESVKALLNTWQASVIKGNAGELAALAGTTEVQSKGVDSIGSGFKDPIAFVKSLAKRERCIVVMTGPTDYISNGVSVVSIKNGDPILGQITGSGCILGSCIASFCATATAHDGGGHLSEGSLVHEDVFIGAIAGVLVLTIAAQLAVESGDVRGPGTFLPGLIDTLWKLTEDDVRILANISIH